MNNNLPIKLNINENGCIYKIIDVVKSVVSKKGQAVIAIDGRCGSGKTTLAEKMAVKLNAAVIHMDDFYLPRELRTEERREQAGGNVHYERFNEEVAEKIRRKQDITYRKFSCRTMDYQETIDIGNPKVIIIEGSYSMHPLYSDIYDIKIFFDIDKETQKNRIIRRNGLEKYKDFKNKWIPMEEKYFEAFNIRNECNYILKNY